MKTSRTELESFAITSASVWFASAHKKKQTFYFDRTEVLKRGLGFMIRVWIVYVE